MVKLPHMERFCNELPDSSREFKIAICVKFQNEKYKLIWKSNGRPVCYSSTLNLALVLDWLIPVLFILYILDKYSISTDFYDILLQISPLYMALKLVWASSLVLQSFFISWNGGCQSARKFNILYIPRLVMMFR